ncbi:Filamentous Growth Regulator [Sporothrix stenoceras]|uniref:Filamentous Growth Regulator n=1 Tax=Sporothrix stenoceras TaxID=5173 RepID=A0ABR3YHN1_9PEZI
MEASVDHNNEKKVQADVVDLKAVPPMDIGPGDLISYGDVDPVLAAKMHLLNEAINEIGWTNYQLKLFFLNGFGYAVDSLLTFYIGIANPQAVLEFRPPYAGGGTIALYAGLLVGVLGWGLSADIIGRRWAFNLSLVSSAILTIIVGASPNYNFFAAFVALAAAGAGGNLALDTTVFLEFLPSKYQFMIVVMALWWGVGQTVAGLMAWGFMPNFSCTSADFCPKSENMGWRYLYYVGGGFVLVLSMLRIFVFRFRETPKYLLCSGQDEACVELLQDVAKKYNRPCNLTLDQLQRLGTVTTAHAATRFSLSEVAMHFRGLFATRKMAITSVVLWMLWACIGLAYPLYYIFLPTYLATRGAKFGETSPYYTWRNYTLANFCAIFGPLFAGYITTIRVIGRKFTMVIGALSTMAIFFGYTSVKSADQNIALNCIGSLTINIYFSALYAYSPEVLPSAHRATGTGFAISFARVMGIVAAVIGTHVDTSTSVPIYVAASLFAVMAILAAIAPYEPQRGQSI